jgi:hypothetical protein
MAISDHGETRRRRNLPALLLSATVLEPPVTADGFLRVKVDHQGARPRECPWQPRPIEEPSAGDAAWVMEDDEGNLVVVCWWPQ